MKKRQIKKEAKKFIKNKVGYPTSWERESNSVIAEYAILPLKVERKVLEIAERDGWDGCHWDNPLIVSMEEV